MALERFIWLAGKMPALGSALRWWARRFPDGSVVTIRCGRAAGFRWKRYHRYVSGFWIGQFELPVQDAIVAHLKPGDTFFDVGAHAGFFTLVAAQRVGPTGHCVAFEPEPLNAQTIRELLALNALADNCRVAQEAVGETAGTALFTFDESNYSTGHLANCGATAQRTFEVNVTTLDAAAARFGPPHLVKMDIEGAEVAALRGASRTLLEFHPTFLIELHGDHCGKGVRQVLSEVGYTFFSVDGRPLSCDAPFPQHIIAKHARM